MNSDSSKTAPSDANLLNNLRLLSKIDSVLAGIFAEKKKLEQVMSQKSETMRKSEFEFGTRSKILTDKKARLKKEEQSVNYERQTLIDRRKALASLGNYKLQQAAEREIEFASKQVDARESTVLKMLEEVERLDTEFVQVQTALTSLCSEFKKFEEEMRATLVNYEDRERQLGLERAEIEKLIDASSLVTYNRVRSRFPMDAVVKIENQQCSGCHMQIGPQILVQISRGTTLVRCPGCGRILFLES